MNCLNSSFSEFTGPAVQAVSKVRAGISEGPLSQDLTQFVVPTPLT